MSSKMGISGRETALVLRLDRVAKDDVALVGGKNAALGELLQNLVSKGIRVPNGFCVTASGYRLFLKENGLAEKISRELRGLDKKNVEHLAKAGKTIRHLMLETPLPEKLENAVISAYRDFEIAYGKNFDAAVRSSATAEDLPTASFAGQQETYLNITGTAALLIAVKKCFASLFTDRAISYREDKGFDHFKVALSVGIQKMVRSDIGSAGVMFSLDTETGFKDVILINAAWGLGESVVQGSVNPDQFILFKPSLRMGKKSVLSKKLGDKLHQVVYSHKNPTKTIDVPDKKRKQFCISDDDAITLAKWGLLVEDHFSKKAGKWVPMDMEWAKDGNTGELFMVQARPETVQSQKNLNEMQTYFLKTKKESAVLVSGESVGEKIGSGKAHVILSVHEIGEFKAGEILVTDSTDPDWEPIMKIASGIVTNSGGRTSHAAIVSRELGIPCIVGTRVGTDKIKTGQKITVDCSQGETGKVLEGLIAFGVKKTRLDSVPKTRTQIMVNLGNPEQAFETGRLPTDGVGLCREEFIIAGQIGIHPLALIHFDKVKEPAVRKKIEDACAGYPDKKLFFVEKLASGIALIAAAFYPKPVILRFSDFKSNEYAQLLGGTVFEPKEENPMIGWRGASRYYSPEFKEAFGLECEAVKRVRDEMGLTNLKVMVPFCRTVAEGKRVIEEMKKNGLRQGERGLEVFVMCEIPSNVILAHDFARVFDGFSIGSNDLTQLTLGLDRDSALVAELYDERNPAVLSLIKDAVLRVKRQRKKIGICGQAPSDYPEFVEFLVSIGIDSISLNPDALIKTKLLVAKIEHKLAGLAKKAE
ncbi:MAG: phosphoenolpyruvate synthase [Candidatus Micrarchaeota archaeon]